MRKWRSSDDRSGLKKGEEKNGDSICTTSIWSQSSLSCSNFAGHEVEGLNRSSSEIVFLDGITIYHSYCEGHNIADHI